MNTIYFLLSLICTRQIFHYMRNEQCNDCVPITMKLKQINITHPEYSHDVVNQFLKFPPPQTFIKNIKMDNRKFWWMLFTVFI